MELTENLLGFQKIVHFPACLSSVKNNATVASVTT